MSSLFANTHNVVAILEKSDAAEGFEQIIDFLNGSYIHYALTMNLHIYVACIKKFWNTASVKRSYDITRLQALVDKKKIVILEDVIREILQLDDAEGVVCLPNEKIFAGLAQMGYEKSSTKLTFYKVFFSSQWKFLIHTHLQSLSAKRTSWNEFSTAMASAVICLSTGQKFNFSKYKFDSLVHNVDSSLKFFMYPRFIQLIIQNQIGDLSTHTISYISLALTQKVFANMRRVRKEDVANEAIPSTPTPLILPSPPSHDIPSTNQVQSSPPHQPQSSPQAPPQEHDKAAQKLEIIELKAKVKRLERANNVKSSKLRRLRKVGTSQRVVSSDDIEDVFNQGRMIDNLDKDKGIELVVDQVKDADTAETKGRHAAEQAEKQAEIYHLDLDHPSKVLISVASATISAAKPSIPAAAPTGVAAYTRRRKGVIIRDPEEELSSKTLAKTPKLKNKGKGILIETPKPMKKKDQIELDAEYARKLHEEINKDIDWDAAIDHHTAGYKLDFFKGMSYDEICQSFKLVHKAAKRRKLNEEAQEVKDLKKHLEVVNDEDDDEFIEATPLVRKLILLVERRYPLSRFTLEQLVNVTRLQVEEESEMSLELLRGQNLADFIVEWHDSLVAPIEVEEELSNPWTLFTDRLSCVDGSRAGLILTSLKGTKFTYALRFEFDTTNNEAEYEALIGKEVMVESDTLKKQRLQEEIDAQVARELEEQLEREDKRMTEQIARDAEVARIHAEEEL
uniref:Reverse transcriptase domain-containing protein n=1 Tax=Tanacetum cinerariifolium TaxID=118510 RepID=A0A6L2MKV8_TANCI|nr:reverse transcriptase domain-containing protein [Tanacetum cinerariifolium]